MVYFWCLDYDEIRDYCACFHADDHGGIKELGESVTRCSEPWQEKPHKSFALFLEVPSRHVASSERQLVDSSFGCAAVNSHALAL